MMDEDGSDKAKPDVSDDDVREKLRAVLPDVDLQTTTEKQLRKQLEKHFGCDLKSRKAVFKEEIESFLLKNQELFEDDEDKEEPEEEERPKKSKKRTGLAQRQSLSEQMQTFLGCDETADYARTDIVKLIWEYIKANDLQDPKNKKKILPDEKLKLIFTFPLDMFTMNKQLSKHLKPSGSVISSSDAAPPKKKAKKKEAPENGEKKKSGFAAPLQLSEPLAELVGQQAASRGEVMKALWAYIKEHELQNPDNKKMILVSKDEKLHGVLGVDKCEGFSMSKYLKEHFLGPAQ